MIFELVQDFSAAISAMPKDHPRHRIITLVEEAIRRDIHFIDRHPTTLFQCMWNSCWWYDCPQASDHYHKSAIETDNDAIDAPWNLTGPKLHVEMQNWLEARSRATPGSVWLRSLRPLPDPAGASMKGRLALHDLAVLDISFSPDGVRLASGSADSTIRIWDTQSGAEIACLQGHETRVTSVDYFSDNIRLASGSDDETIRVWDTTTGECIACLKGHEGWVLAVAVSPDRNQVASASSDGTVRVWHWQSGENSCLGLHEPWARTVAFSPDGQLIASGGSDMIIRVWNAGSGKSLGSIEGHDGEIRALAFSPDGNSLASAGGISIRIWNLAEMMQQIKLEGPTKAIRSIAWLPDGETICGGAEDGTARLWDCTSGREIFSTLEDHHNWVTSVAVTPYMNQIAAAYADGSVRLLDLSTKPDRQRIIGHRQPINGVGFFDGGSKFVSWSLEGLGFFPTAFVWDVDTGAFLGTAPGWSLMLKLETANCRRVGGTGGETGIRTTQLGPLGWISAELSEICCNIDRRVWAGCYNKDVYIFKLEGDVEIETKAEAQP